MLKYILLPLCVSLIIASRLSHAAELRPESLEDYNARVQWFNETHYGMFIHFGLYSMLGGEWKGKRIPDEGPAGQVYSEWIMNTLHISRVEYAELAKQFNPIDFDAETIVWAARNAGMTYLVITAKHHDGFCLWDSEFTDFDLNSTPIKGRDLLLEIKQACERHSIRFGIYYSILDWNHPAQPSNAELKAKRDPAMQVIFEKRIQDYISYQRNQVLELLEKYDPAVLWFDGDWAKWWTLENGIELYNSIRAADSDVIVNNRVAKRQNFELDFVTQEQKHFDHTFAKPWEGCYTMNHSWGYKKGDDNWKSAEEVYHKLKDINEKGGALLLNVGPNGDGVVQSEAYAILTETADLLKANPIKKRIPKIEVLPGVKE